MKRLAFLGVILSVLLTIQPTVASHEEKELLLPINTSTNLADFHEFMQELGQPLTTKQKVAGKVSIALNASVLLPFVAMSYQLKLFGSHIASAIFGGSGSVPYFMHTGEEAAHMAFKNKSQKLGRILEKPGGFSKFLERLEIFISAWGSISASTTLPYFALTTLEPWIGTVPAACVAGVNFLASITGFYFTNMFVLRFFRRAFDRTVHWAKCRRKVEYQHKISVRKRLEFAQEFLEHATSNSVNDLYGQFDKIDDQKTYFDFLRELLNLKLQHKKGKCVEGTGQCLQGTGALVGTISGLSNYDVGMMSTAYWFSLLNIAPSIVERVVGGNVGVMACLSMCTSAAYGTGKACYTIFNQVIEAITYCQNYKKMRAARKKRSKSEIVKSVVKTAFLPLNVTVSALSGTPQAYAAISSMGKGVWPNIVTGTNFVSPALTNFTGLNEMVQHMGLDTKRRNMIVWLGGVLAGFEGVKLEVAHAIYQELNRGTESIQ
ncbi:MAG: hypothetical protein ACPGXY_06705 [Alphaproteobacteria bacterium]